MKRMHILLTAPPSHPNLIMHLRVVNDIWLIKVCVFYIVVSTPSQQELQHKTDRQRMAAMDKDHRQVPAPKTGILSFRLPAQLRNMILSAIVNMRKPAATISCPFLEK